MVISEEKKHDIKNRIVDAMVAANESGQLSDAELPLIADFVLKQMDQVTSESEFVTFLKLLSERWGVFANVSVVEQGVYERKVENQATQGVLALAKDGKIDDAIQLAKSVTNN